MKLNDFCHALDSGNIARAAWGCETLVSAGAIVTDLRVDADEWHMELLVSADNGYRWSRCWPLFADSSIIDPLRHMPLEMQFLAARLGLILSDFGSALVDAAPRLIVSDEPLPGPEDGGPRSEAERMTWLSRQIEHIERCVRRWEAPLAALERDAQSRGTRTITLEVMGVAS